MRPMKQQHTSIVRSLIVSSAIGLGLSSCLPNPDPNAAIKSCIVVPPTSNKSETDAALDLSASLIADIGSPTLGAKYKRAAETSFATLSQKTLDQLVVAQFVVCVKKHHSKDLSPETIASLEDSLRIAVAKAAGARSLAGPLTPAIKSAVRRSPNGELKLAAIEDAL